MQIFQIAAVKTLKEKLKQDAKKAVESKVSSVHDERLIASCQSYFLKVESIQRPGCNINVKWTMQDDLLQSDSPSPVLVPTMRCEAVADQLRALDYYRDQKTWVKAELEKAKLDRASAVILKPSVCKKVCEHLVKLGMDLPPPTATSPDLREVFQPQFFQCKAGGFIHQNQTDYGLVECIFSLEGSEVILGFPHAILEGPTFADRMTFLMKQLPETMMMLLQEQGFVYTTEPNAIIALPPGYTTMCFNVSQTTAAHGVRWLLPGSQKTLSVANALLAEVKALDAKLRAVLEYVQASVA